MLKGTPRLGWRRLALLLTWLAAACTPAAPTTPPAASPSAGPTAAPTAAPTLAPTTAPTAAATLRPLTLYLAPELPASLRSAVHLPAGWAAVDAPGGADARLEIGEQHIVGYWTLALAAPFPTLADGAASQDLRQAWAGQPAAGFPTQPLLLSESTRSLVAAWWGQPGAAAVKILPEADLVTTAWSQRAGAGCACALLPFESLEPRWKTLAVDGISPLHKEFTATVYALNVPISLQLAEPAAAAFWQANPPAALAAAASNRDPGKLTVVAMTGTTALGRATAWEMEQKGILYPGQDVRALLRAADITHISNEVPFDPTCHNANPSQNPQIVFCSPPGFIALLEDVGADVIELDGDHMNDRGPEAFAYTLQLYKDHHLPYYGGGANLEEGSRPALFESNGNKIAFIGCNAKPQGGYATASESRSGAVHCYWDAVTAQIAALKAQGYQVIVTFQHNERWTYTVDPNDRPDYLRVVDAGAVVVQGSQAHQPQNFELYQGALIHYGTGNLFFDQVNIVDSDGQHVADKSFIDEQFFYNGRYLGAELVTLQFVDYARPRLMTPGERQAFLTLMFKASGW